LFGLRVSAILRMKSGMKRNNRCCEKTVRIWILETKVDSAEIDDKEAKSAEFEQSKVVLFQWISHNH
jgi:hypothetical protein